MSTHEYVIRKIHTYRTVAHAKKYRGMLFSSFGKGIFFFSYSRYCQTNKESSENLVVLPFSFSVEIAIECTRGKFV